MRSFLAALFLSFTLAPAAHAQIIAGKVLIKLEQAPKSDPDARAALSQLAAAEHLDLSLEKRTVLGWVVAAVDAADAESTQKAIGRLRGAKGVAAADAVTLKRALRAPNDELYSELWGFSGIDIERAWDTTIGLPTQRIGMIDSGINRDHIDLIEHDLRGFDFISDPGFALDGNGRDGDYSDDAPSNGFHGSHVAGTMVASADDGIGVPGLNWNAQLVTARAIGDGGGSVVDIAEAALWLAGAHIDGVPDLAADRVSVINMSLGSDDPCSSFESDVYSEITGAGVAVVAAAGNTDNFTPTGSPASCPGVIAVGAAGPTFELTSYSNFDSRIDIVAPGGDGFGSGDPSESILSVDGSRDFSYVAIDGTSMASPHVAGVVSLMQAVNPRLSPRQIKDILAQSPFTCGSCDNKAFLDAPSAVALAQETTGELGDTPQPGGGSGGGGSGGGSSGGNDITCPPSSSLTSDGTGCACDNGFVPNAAGTACVAEPDDGCPANSDRTSDPSVCECDLGFVVNAAQTACVLPEDNAGGAGAACENAFFGGTPCQDGFVCEDSVCVSEDSRDDREDDDDDNSERSLGCSASNAPADGCALFAVLFVLGRTRRLRR